MRKTTIILSIIFGGLLLSCTPRANKYYAGIVMDETGHPVAGALVKENTETDALETSTSENGFFKLTRNEGIVCNLRIEKDGYETQTISTFGFRGNDVEEMEIEYYSFLTSDTTKIVLQMKK